LDGKNTKQVITMIFSTKFFLAVETQVPPVSPIQDKFMLHTVHYSSMLIHIQLWFTDK